MADVSTTEDGTPDPNDDPINLQIFQIVWLDDLSTSKTTATPSRPTTASSDTRHCRQLLRELNPSIRFFTDQQECLDFMKTIRKEVIFLIIPGALAKETLSQIHAYDGLSAVFVFCEDRLRFARRLEKYNKIRGIFENEDDLLNSVKNAIEEVEENNAAFTILNSKGGESFRLLSEEKETFLWQQLLWKLLPELPSGEHDRNEFADRCARLYRDNRQGKEKIELFRINYRKEAVIEWYTGSSFFYRTVNKALRVNEIGWIHSMRSVIVDTNQHLERENQTLKNSSPLTLFRGQQLPKAQLDKVRSNIGQVIIASGYLSTSRSEEQAKRFCRSDNAENAKLLFEISVDPSRDVLFADISHLSRVPHEAEVLFAPNATFVIDSVELDNNSERYRVKMTAVDDGERLTRNHMNTHAAEMSKYSPAVQFGHILFAKLHQKDQAEIYYKKHLRALLPEDHDQPLVHHQLGDIYSAQSKWSTALFHYNKAKEMYSTPRYLSYAAIVDCLLVIGDIHLVQKQEDQAFGPLKQAENIVQKNLKTDNLRLAKVLRMMGKWYIVQARNFLSAGERERAREMIDQKARPSIERAHQLLLQCEPRDYAEVAAVFGDLSSIYEMDGDEVNAQSLLSEQLELTLEHLPDDHARRNTYLMRFRRFHDSHGMEDISRNMVDRIERDQENRFGRTSINVAKTLLAGGRYTEACRILFEIEPFDEETVERCLDHLFHHKKMGRNLRWFQKWLTYLTANYPSTERRTAKALHQMACIYHYLGNHGSSSKCLRQALSIYRYHNDRLGMRSIEDSGRHFGNKGRISHYIVNIVCPDNWENSLIFRGSPSTLF